MHYATLSTKELVDIAERDARFNMDPLFTALVERLWRMTSAMGWAQGAGGGEHLNTSEVHDVRPEPHA